MSLLYYYACLAAQTLPPPRYEYLPENALASGWANTGTAGRAYDLLPEAGTAEAITGPNGVNALRFPPGVSMQTALPLDIIGTQPRTMLTILRVSDSSDGALMGWGAAAQGQLFDLLAYQGAFQFHTYGDQRVVRDIVPGQWVAVLGSGQLEPGGFVVRDQTNGPLAPFTNPVVDTAPGTFTVGRGRFNEREATQDVAGIWIWDAQLTGEDRVMLDQQGQPKYQISIL